MFCLTRKAGERVIIDGNIVVTVLQIRSDGAVRLGFDAPPGVPIHRDNVKNVFRKPVEQHDPQPTDWRQRPKRV